MVRSGWLALALAACGGEDRRTWEMQADTAQTVVQALAAGGDLQWDGGSRRTANVIESRDCPESGGATECDDGTIQFADCVWNDGDRWNGAIVVQDGPPQTFTFQDFAGEMRGRPFSAQGGYVTTNDGVRATTTINLTWSGQDYEDEADAGRAYTSVATGWMYLEGELVTGSMNLTTTTEGRDEPTVTMCAFKDEPMPDLVDLQNDTFFRQLCAKSWDVTTTVVRKHDNDSDPNPIHILVNGEAFSESANRVTPGGANSMRVDDPIVGTTVTLQVGRGGTVFGNTSCVVSSQHEVIEAVYDDGFGLESFSFYCTTALDRQWGCATGGGPDCL